MLSCGGKMMIEFEIEEGCYEYINEYSGSTISIIESNQTSMYGHFNFAETEDTYTKMKELNDNNKGIQIGNNNTQINTFK